MENTKENRREPRIAATYVSVEVRTEFGETTPSQECRVADLSIGGMRFTIASPIPSGQLVRLTFKLPGMGLPIRTEAIVIHCQMGNDHYSVGTQFKGLGLAEYGFLREFVRQNLSDT